MLMIGVPRESTPGETRVALVPQSLAALIKAGLAVQIEAGAGVSASFPDDAYRAAGATIVTDTRTVFGSDIVLKVREPRRREDLATHEAELMRAGAVLITFLNAARDGEAADMLAARRVTTFAMERIPRISRAQNMDALSSMSTVAGYKAALLAAEALPRFFPLLMTAAGTIAPARVFVLGAGVAGLQAIATARRLGAVVEAFDVRPAVRDEVKSLGATFVAAELASDANVGSGGYAKALSDEQEKRMRDVIAASVQNADVVIATANVPGRRAPVMVTSDMVQKMKPGSVIVDLAAESGGNCQLTEPGADVVRHGVTIRGPINLAATLPVHASQMYARNVSALLLHLVKNGELNLDFNDEITRGTCLTHDGRRLDTPQSSAPAVTVPA
jgi:H+-translocating NAD(P) transhydrogenase subunit alpha